MKHPSLEDVEVGGNITTGPRQANAAIFRQKRDETCFALRKDFNQTATALLAARDSVGQPRGVLLARSSCASFCCPFRTEDAPLHTPHTLFVLQQKKEENAVRHETLAFFCC